MLCVGLFQQQGEPELMTEAEKMESQALLKHHMDARPPIREIFLRLRDGVTAEKKRERKRRQRKEEKIPSL